MAAVILLSAAGTAAANPKVSYIAPFVTGPASSQIGQPLGISISFSESVYGFTVNDIVSNGQVVSVDGRNSNYRITVIPRQRILTLEILTDGVFGVGGAGNDPLEGGPFIFDTATNQVLSYHQYRPSFAARNFAIPSAYGALQYQQPDFAPGFVFQQRQPVEIFQQPQQPAQVNVQVQAPQEEEKRERPPGATKVRFILNLGVITSAGDFINLDDENGMAQTEASAANSAEVTFGLETITPLPANPELGIGFYATTGFYDTRYTGGTENVDQANGRYNAIPLELGAGFHYREFMTISGGIFTHINGLYSHSGYFRPAAELLRNAQEADNAQRAANEQLGVCDPASPNNDCNVEFAVGLPNGAIGGVLNFTFRYSKVGFTIKYHSILLNNFSEDNEGLDLEDELQGEQVEYQFLPFLQGAGFYLSFNT